LADTNVPPKGSAAEENSTLATLFSGCIADKVCNCHHAV